MTDAAPADPSASPDNAPDGAGAGPRKPRKIFLLVGIVLAVALGVFLFTGLGTSQGSFTVHGVAVLKSASMLYNNRVVEPLPMPTSFTATIAGSGSIGFHRAEWKGTITGSGQKVEIVPISP